MNRHENSSTRKPTVVKVGNAVVKIYHGKSRGYDLFTVVHYAGGQRKRETFAKLADAKHRAGEVARAMLNGRLAVLELTSADREGYVSAVQLLEPLEIPLHSAVQEYVAARSHLQDGESLLSAVKEHAARRRHVVDKPVRETVEEFLLTKKRDGASHRYLKSLRSDLRRLAEAFRINIGSVTSGMLVEWLKSLSVGARARNNIRASVVTLFHFARALGYLPKGRPTEADDVPKAKYRGGEIGILSPKELADLLRHGNEEARLYLAIAGFSGLRTAELLRLSWEDINFGRGHIVVGKEKSKTRTRRLVPIQPNLLKWLAPYRGQTGQIFAGQHTPDRIIGFAKKHVTWKSNCLRHSFATYRLAQTHDAARVALEMGNSPTMLFTNYRELADENDAAAWFAIAPKRAKNVLSFDAKAG
jgi:integrase